MKREFARSACVANSEHRPLKRIQLKNQILDELKGVEMPGKRHSPGQILRKLREVEVALAKGEMIARAVGQIAVTEQTYYRWRNEYGGLSIDQADPVRSPVGRQQQRSSSAGNVTIQSVQHARLLPLFA